MFVDVLVSVDGGTCMRRTSCSMRQVCAVLPLSDSVRDGPRRVGAVAGAGCAGRCIRGPGLWPGLGRRDKAGGHGMFLVARMTPAINVESNMR